MRFNQTGHHASRDEAVVHQPWNLLEKRARLEGRTGAGGGLCVRRVKSSHGPIRGVPGATGEPAADALAQQTLLA